ncbi:Uncharacterised protein [Enterobacter hormaechei]|nr:hypothetical protein L359_04390 [Enterobacter hormaechei subsp. hoffmannii MGH 13]EUM97934.1 hypothetical protein L350_05600 [Enterobacter sp. MGH 4]VAG27442.1 Uncharacterised protein [Enterobacter hormaechei]VAM24149.1 Uncharacterised protein [Enterobacter hormaechei]VEB14682.1 Uncharacterised protein [Enterobacter hormaechei]
MMAFLGTPIGCWYEKDIQLIVKWHMLMTNGTKQ